MSISHNNALAHRIMRNSTKLGDIVQTEYSVKGMNKSNIDWYLAAFNYDTTIYYFNDILLNIV